MKTLRILILTLFLLGIVVCGLSTAYAAVPHLINYQGRLTDKSGKPAEGVYDITFKIYNASSGAGTMAPWEDKHANVNIQKGVFSILLGSFTPLNLAFDEDYFLEIQFLDKTIGASEIMSPRQRITSVGYAIRAENADKAGAAEGVIKATGGLIIEVRTSDPAAPVEGQMWLKD